MRQPHRIADVLGELVAKRGYAGVQAGQAMQSAWQAAAGEMAATYTKVGALRHGVLNVYVANSTVLHELTFRKTQLIAALARSLPEQRLRGVRFRLAPLE